MIQANDLRVGNIVLYIYSGFSESSIIRINDIGNIAVWGSDSDGKYLINLKNIIPIQLTKEILLKCGFELNLEKTLFIIKSCGLMLMDVKGLYYMANSLVKTDIKYLHQLQNLYYALTGVELQVNISI